jgi:hypothetical protein
MRDEIVTVAPPVSVPTRHAVYAGDVSHRRSLQAPAIHADVIRLGSAFELSVVTVCR